MFGIQEYHSPDLKSTENVSYTIDSGAPVVNATIELQTSSTAYMFPLFYSGTLSQGQHNLTLVNNGATLTLTYFKVGVGETVSGASSGNEAVSINPICATQR